MSNYPKYDKYNQYKKGKKPSLSVRFKEFLLNSKRVIKVASKPTRSEYMMTFKICIIGIVLLGVISYLLSLLFGEVIVGILIRNVSG